MTHDTLTFCAPTSAEIDFVWPTVEPLVREGMSNADYTSEDVRDFLKHGHAQMWYTLHGTPPTIECCLVSRIIHYPARSVCQLWIAAGKLPPCWTSLLEIVERWAREQGSKAMIVHGRPGWERKLGAGWTTREVWMERPLCSG